MKTEHILRLINTAKDGYEKYKPVFESITNNFLGNFDNNIIKEMKRRDKSSLFIPVVGSKVRRILASFQEAYFSNDDIVKISQQLTGNAPEEIINTLQIAFNYYIRNKTKPFSVLTRNMLQGILYGTPIIKAYWGESRPVIENISIHDCYLDPQAQSAQDIKYLVHCFKLARVDIYNLQNSGFWNGDFNDDFMNDPFKREQIHDVYYFHNNTWFVASMLENKKLRDDVLHDGLPFIIGALLPQMYNENETNVVKAYGDSPTSILLPLQKEINIRRNQQIDAIALALNPRILAQSGSLIDPNLLKKGAGQIIECDDINGIKFMSMPSLQESIFDVQRLDLEAQEALGVTNYNSGVSSGDLNQTATGISVLSAEANTRIQSLIRAYNETLIEPLMTRLAQLIYKYDDVFMGNFALRQPLDIMASINTGIGATNPQTQINNLQTAFSMFLQTQNIKGANAVIDEMLPLLGIKNKEKFTQEPLEPQQALEEMS